MNDINTHGQTIDYGKHKGELFTRLPLGYLRWMVNESAPQADVAKAELERRGATLPRVNISNHAIDRASLRVLELWQQDRGEDEGLHSWLERVTVEAIAQGRVIGDRIHYKRMKFCIAHGEEFPTLKTIMRNGAAA